MKSHSIYVCQSCGSQYPKWAGKCSNCGQWNSLVETVVSTSRISAKGRSSYGRKNQSSLAQPIKLSEVKSQLLKRIDSDIGELNRVLGGGIVPGSVVLVAGSPGMGKSTLLTQLALKVAETDLLRSSNENFSSSNRARRGMVKEISSGRDAVYPPQFAEQFRRVNKKTEKFSSTPRKSSLVLYVCGEESPAQVKLRVDRLLGHQPLPENLLLLPETNVEAIMATLLHCYAGKREKNNVTMKQFDNGLVIVDSIQTMWTEKLTGVAGSVGQIRESAQMLLQFAKENNVAIFLVGHVTKEGAIAGPKVLEHLVDVVLYLEGDGRHEFRLLRSVKNRFGSTDEVCVFLMRDNGMEEVVNPSEIFLPEMAGKATPGSSVVVSLQGSRPVLVEIQALVTPTSLAIPRRIATGLDQRRLQVLCAILQKHAGLSLYNKDVYVNVAGGLTLREPAADLGVCLAIASSYKNKPVKSKGVAIGEVGLLGELRRVSFLEKRLKEAQAQGYKRIMSFQIVRDIKQAVKQWLH